MYSLAVSVVTGTVNHRSAFCTRYCHTPPIVSEHCGYYCCVLLLLAIENNNW